MGKGEKKRQGLHILFAHFPSFFCFNGGTYCYYNFSLFFFSGTDKILKRIRNIVVSSIKLKSDKTYHNTERKENNETCMQFSTFIN